MFPPWPAFVAQADAFSLIEFADVKAARPDASAELFIGGATGLVEQSIVCAGTRYSTVARD
jgi:hypothetical protein